MKKFLFQPCFWAVVALGALATSCKPAETVEQRPSVSISLDEVTTSSIKATFTPSEGASKFAYALGLASDEASFLAGEDTETMFIQEVLNTESDFSAKTVSWNSDIEPNTYYVLYARAFDSKGNAGPLSARGFNTSSDDFKVELQYVSDVTAGFHITCTNDYYSYVFAFGLAANKEQDMSDFENNLMEGMITKSNVYDLYINNFHLDSDGASYTLEPETDYVFYCMGLDRANGNTGVIAVDFTTAAADAVPNYKIEAGEMDFIQQHYTVEPNDKALKVALWQNSFGSDYEEVMFGQYNWQGNLLAMFDSWAQVYTPEQAASNGNADFMTFSAIEEPLNAAPYTTNMELDQNVEVYVLCYDDSFAPANVRKHAYKTPALNKELPTPKAEDFTVTMSKKTANDIAFEITYTGDATRAYYFDLYNGKLFDDDVAANGPESALATVRSKLPAEGGFIYNEPNSGTITFSSLDKPFMTPGEKWYIAIAPMNANGPVDDYGYGEVVMYEFFAE